MQGDRWGLRLILISAVTISAVFVMGFYNDRQPNAEELVAQPREQIYAELERRYTRLIAQAKAHPTETEGRRRAPVKFALEREPGHGLELNVTAGWRDIELHTWLEDGPAPGQTWVRVRFQPESIRERGRESTLLGTVYATLGRAEAELRAEQPVRSLLGGNPPRRHRRRHEMPHRDHEAHIDPSSTRPMVDVTD